MHRAESPGPDCSERRTHALAGLDGTAQHRTETNTRGDHDVISGGRGSGGDGRYRSRLRRYPPNVRGPLRLVALPVTSRPIPASCPGPGEILRPALLSGAVQRLSGQRVDVSELPRLPRLSREALASRGVDAVSLPVIRTVCQSFTRVSPINLVVAACLAGLLEQGASGRLSRRPFGAGQVSLRQTASPETSPPTWFVACFTAVPRRTPVHRRLRKGGE